MTRIYAELGAGILLAIIGVLCGWHFGSLDWKGKYDALVMSDTQASADAAVKAAKQIQDDRDAYDAQLKTITDGYHLNVSASDATADGLTLQLRNYANQLQRCSMPKGGAAAIGADDASGKPGSDPGLAAAIDGVTGALGRVVKASGRDSDKLTALQAERKSLNQEIH